MKSSRIALSLLLVLQGVVVIALGNVNGQADVATRVQAAETVPFDAHDSFGPETVTDISGESTHVPAILPGVNPLDTDLAPSLPIAAEESDCYWYEYDVDYEEVHGGQTVEQYAVDDLETSHEADSTCEYAPCHDYGVYYSEYGYDSIDQAELSRLRQESVASISNESPAKSVNADYMGYSLAYPDEENAYPETLSSESTEVAADVDCYQYDFGDAYGYEYDYAYDYEYDYMTEVPEILSEEEPEVAYDYVDPYEYYGYGYDFDDTAAIEPTPLDLGSQSGQNLSAWQPAELLSEKDTNTLISLAALDGTNGSALRTLMSSYLEELGWYAVDFAVQFEEATGVNVLDYCEDAMQVATFLATYRLYEQGEVSTDEAVDLLARSMGNLPTQWLNSVRQLADTPTEVMANPAEWASFAQNITPLVNAAQSLGSRSLVILGGAVLGVSSELSGLRWKEILSQAQQLREACIPSWGVRAIQR